MSLGRHGGQGGGVPGRCRERGGGVVGRGGQRGGALGGRVAREEEVALAVVVVMGNEE